MSIQSPSSHHPGHAGRIVAAAVIGALAMNGCTEKEADFFTAIGDLPTLGAVEVFVTGAPAGATVQFIGPGTSRTELVTSSGRIFADLALGTYTSTITPPDGYTCSPPSITSTLTGTFPAAEVSFACEEIPPALSTLRFTTTGLTGSTTFPLSITGPASLSGNLGVGGLVFNGLDAGTYGYSLDLGSTPMYQCAPATGSATLTAGQEAVVAVACQLLPGAATVQVTGLGAGTASVAWSGPASGNAVFGNSPGNVADLPAGTYAFTITDPSGFDCTPPSQQVTVVAGASQAVLFNCTAIAAQPLTVGVHLSGVQGAPGAVPAASYSVNLLDGGSPVGTTTIQALGGNTFIGFTPDRLGLGNGGAYRFDLGVDVGGQPFNVSGFAICSVNGAVSGGSPLVVTFLDQAEAVTGTENVTTVPTCAWMVVPANTRYAHVTWPNAGFVDFNGIQYWRP